MEASTKAQAKQDFLDKGGDPELFAPGDNADFKTKIQAFYATLTKKNPKDGVFANNARKNENMRLVAQFAQDNDLQSMLNPLTGKSYKFADASDADVPGETEPEEVNMDLPTLERMADVGELTPGVLAKLGNEMLAAKSGEAGLGGRTVSSLFGIEDPETADKIQNIMAKNAAARTAEPDAAGTDADAPGYPGVDDLGGGAASDEIVTYQEPSADTAAATKAPAAKAEPEHPGKPHPKPSASTKNPDGSRVTYGSLAAASGIDDPNKIGIGDKITLPGGGEYIVKKGDTLSKIAQDVRLGNIGAPVKPIPPVQGDTRGQEVPVAPATPAGQPDDAYATKKTTKVVPGTVGTLDSQAAAPVDTSKAAAEPVDPTDSWVDTSKAAAAPEKEPTVGGVSLPGKAAAPTKKPDNVRLPTTKRVRAPKTPTAAPKIGSMLGAGYDGMPRLKYLAGIKGKK